MPRGCILKPVAFYLRWFYFATMDVATLRESVLPRASASLQLTM
jgi:hypothetical protein